MMAQLTGSQRGVTLYIQDEEGNGPSEEDSCVLQARVLKKLKDLSTGWCLLLP